MADILIQEWLTLCTPKFASKFAQFARLVSNTTRDLIEIIKYGSKIFTEPDVRKKIKQKGKSQIYASALDNIIQAMKGHRIFNRFGFNLPKQEKIVPGSRFISEFEKWEFNIKLADWENVNSDEVLAGYLPPDDLLRILSVGVDVCLE